MKCNQSRSGFELMSPCPFSATITITPRAPHTCTYIYSYVYCDIHIHTHMKVNNRNKSDSMKKIEKLRIPKVMNLFKRKSLLKLFGFSKFSSGETSVARTKMDVLIKYNNRGEEIYIYKERSYNHSVSITKIKKIMITCYELWNQIFFSKFKMVKKKMNLT